MVVGVEQRAVVASVGAPVVAVAEGAGMRELAGEIGMVVIGAALDGADELALAGAAALVHGADAVGFFLGDAGSHAFIVGMAAALGGEESGEPDHPFAVRRVKLPSAGGGGSGRGGPPSPGFIVSSQAERVRTTVTRPGRSSVRRAGPTCGCRSTARRPATGSEARFMRPSVSERREPEQSRSGNLDTSGPARRRPGARRIDRSL